MKKIITPNLTNEEQEEIMRMQVMREKWFEIQISLLKALSELERIKKENGRNQISIET